MVLTGKLTQNTTDEVFFYPIQNPTLATISVSIDAMNPNRIIIESDGEIFNSDNPARWYISDSTGNKYSVTPTTRTTADVLCFDPSGNPVTNILTAAIIEL